MKTGNKKESIEVLDNKIIHSSKHYDVLIRKDGMYTVVSKKQLVNKVNYKEFYFIQGAIDFINSIEF